MKNLYSTQAFDDQSRDRRPFGRRENDKNDRGARNSGITGHLSSLASKHISNRIPGHRTATRPVPENEPRGTMTLAERAKFSKIFQSILAADRQTPPKNDENQIWTNSPDANAAAEGDSPPVSAAKKFLAIYPPSLQAEMKYAEEIVRVKKRRKYFRDKAIEERTNPNYLKIKDRLLACTTLDEVLNFAEVELFGPFTKGEVSFEEVSAMTRQETTDLTDFCQAYPLLLKDVMMILRLSYRNHSAAVSIFDRTKKVGIESQVIGIDTAMYNELILTYYEGWNYVSYVLKTLKEMALDAIEPDEYTGATLDYIIEDIIRQRAGSPASRLIWSTESQLKLDWLNKQRQISRARVKLGLYGPCRIS